ncbi:MAG: hypothetical protein M3077_11440 [Candidatus Dormibacteraeota bacterium]|nr:hypothetical protein [Candidatus Dormibacteraeota bacterium]
MIGIAGIAVALAYAATDSVTTELTRLRVELATYALPPGTITREGGTFGRPGEAVLAVSVRPISVQVTRQQLADVLVAHGFRPAGERGTSSDPPIVCFSRAPNDRASFQVTAADTWLDLAGGGSPTC